MSTLARLYNAFIAMGCGCFSVYYMVAYRDAGLTILMIALVNVVFDVSTTLASCRPRFFSTAGLARKP